MKRIAPFGGGDSLSASSNARMSFSHLALGGCCTLFAAGATAWPGAVAVIVTGRSRARDAAQAIRLETRRRHECIEGTSGGIDSRSRRKWAGHGWP